MFKMNALVPEMIVSELSHSLRFYCEVLGFKIEYQREEDRFAVLSFGASQIMLEQDWHSESPWRVGPLERPFGRGMNLSIECPDASALAGALLEAGYELRQAVEERWYRQNDQHRGQRNFLVLDPDGYLLRFAQDLGVK
ncbi:VOC family protein [Pseudomonas sp. P66]|jgi:lactoylglutathione lyase|uniref:Bleomycin resistance protein n=1 Tax=Pseudomonas arcuscaelestis TaxID=2710591 RepID=A0ABS2BZY4_9PSED|nr:VOC family protein [Pseudomonas arcuscaelestis]MBM3112785.1 VOC family protein [Pseudomonas arcuscaelestis]MBM5459187.1 VOC family protein [Pseudomonas arcuscaelestis]